MKKKLGPVNALYPMPTTLVGAMVDGRPNFLTIAHVGILNHGTPQYISLGINKRHYTTRGVHQAKTFSVCLPGENLMVETDYCGLASGGNTDKSGLFTVFYGETETAPMIEECPVCMECRLHDVLDYETHDVVVGEVVATYADENVLSDGGIDITAVRPLLFDMASVQYFALGEALGGCWSVGKEMKQRLKEQKTSM